MTQHETYWDTMRHHQTVWYAMKPIEMQWDMGQNGTPGDNACYHDWKQSLHCFRLLPKTLWPKVYWKHEWPYKFVVVSRLAIDRRSVFPHQNFFPTTVLLRVQAHLACWLASVGLLCMCSFQSQRSRFLLAPQLFPVYATSQKSLNFPSPLHTILKLVQS